MSSTIFWYDFETTGINPRADRALQVAGLRTDENLNPVGEPLNLYCQLSDDILPHPAACQITGISVHDMRSGLGEAEFFARLHAELAQPGTCTAGYNSVRFDDEVTRHGLYRNFYDPYAREWQNSNSRWDILDALRCAWALRPDGINWPRNTDGRPSFRLELLTAANGIEHGQAHDALADVHATIATARLLRQHQPQLYAYLYALRRKAEVQSRLRIGQPCVHISGRFAVERNCLAIVLPLAIHPANPNAVIVADLQSDCSALLNEPAEELRQRLYTRRSQLPQNIAPVPLKLIQVNRCPVVAPLSVLREQDIERLQIDTAYWQAQHQQLQPQLTQLAASVSAIYADSGFSAGPDDPEQQLYDGFIQTRDRTLCEQVRMASARELSNSSWTFDDQRLPELLFRYRARNFPHSLEPGEQQRWQEFCRTRLHDSSQGAPLTIEAFNQAFAQLAPEQQQSTLMQDWLQHVKNIASKYSNSL